MEMLAGREDEFVDGRGAVMAEKQWALVGQMGEVKTEKQQTPMDERDAILMLQAYASVWEATFGWKVVAFVAETVEVFAVQWEGFAHGLQVVPAVRKGVFVKDE